MWRKSKENGWVKSLFLLLIFGGSAFYYYQYHWKPAQKPPAPKYITTTVKTGNIAKTVLASGRVQAIKEVKVGAQVSGEISQLFVKIGDVVKVGDKIAEIDARTQINQRNSAKADLAIKKANLQSAQAKLKETERIYQRHKGLLGQNATSKETVESAESAFLTAKANVAQVQAEIKKSELSLENQELSLSHTLVTAPIAGTIIAVAVEQGSTINAVQTSPTIVTIAQTNQMVIASQIAEADVVHVKTGMKAYFNLLGNPKKRFEGVIHSIDPAPLNVSDNQNTSSETAVYYYGKMSVPNDDNQLKIGMTANTTIIVEEANHALMVPLTALQKDDEVLVLNGTEALPQKITTGLNDGINVEVKSGLNEGQEVVLSTATDKPSMTPRGGMPMGIR